MNKKLCILALPALALNTLACGPTPQAFISASEQALADGPALWITADNSFAEIGRDGIMVHPLTRVPWSHGAPLEHVRGLAVDEAENLVFYNGTAAPVLSITDTSDTWQHRFVPGWSTVSNISYGAVTTYSDFVFATDMNTVGATDRGIVRFHPSDSTFARFETTNDFIDLSLGADNLLYALRSDMRTVQVYDPNTMTRLSSIVLPLSNIRGITADANHLIFAAGWDGNVYLLSAVGAVLASTAAGIGSLIDIDLASDGTIAVGSRTNQVAFIDPGFVATTPYVIPGASTSGGIFVSFAELPTF